MEGSYICHLLETKGVWNVSCEGGCSGRPLMIFMLMCRRLKAMSEFFSFFEHILRRSSLVWLDFYRRNFLLARGLTELGNLGSTNLGKCYYLTFDLNYDGPHSSRLQYINHFIQQILVSSLGFSIAFYISVGSRGR